VSRRETAGRAAASRRAEAVSLGHYRWPAIAAVLAVLALSLGVPLYALGYWMQRGSSTTLPGSSVLSALWTTIAYSAVAALVATVAALPVALYAWRRRTFIARAAERSAYLTRALPGIAVALAIVYFSLHFFPGLYQRPPMLVLAYAILFFPLALTGVRSSLARVPRELEDVARSLGAGPMRILGRVILPLALPGLGVAAALVAISTSTELTATLLLHPTGSETLATQFWMYTSGLAYGAAAPYAALMIGLSALPVVLLARRSGART
jgi:iron(III) transport system permease protein